MSELKIIPVTYSDEIQSISNMANVIWHECYGEILCKKQIDYMLDKYLSVNELTRQIREENYEYYILRSGEENAGYLGIHIEKDRLFLSKLYILNEHRGEKIPTKVISFLEKICRKNLLKSIYLTVNKHNTHACEVYEHLGFAKIDTAVTEIGNGYVMDDYIMELPISICEDEKYMRMALSLALKAKGNTYPNPMVGAVIVHNNNVIGAGYHHIAGEAHAEVNAINSVKDSALMKESTMYVTLEPCSHWGKTPPCADLIIKNEIQRVVIGIKDPFTKVNGQGIDKLKKAGIDVKVGVLEKECAELNERFFTFNTLKRSYVILKWAQTMDGFLDKNRNDASISPEKISGEKAQKLLHKWRSEEMAIMVGTRTALLDNPRLNARLAENSKNPVRVIIDIYDKIPDTHYVKDGNIPSYIFTSKIKKNSKNITYFHVPKDEKCIPELVLKVLYSLGIQSVIVEGGAKLLTSFIQANLWDEARVFVSEKYLSQGVKAPDILGLEKEKIAVGEDTLHIFYNDKIE